MGGKGARVFAGSVEGRFGVQEDCISLRSMHAIEYYSSRRMRRIPRMKRTKTATLSHDRYRASTKTMEHSLLMLLRCWLDYKQKRKI